MLGLILCILTAYKLALAMFSLLIFKPELYAYLNLISVTLRKDFQSN